MNPVPAFYTGAIPQAAGCTQMRESRNLRGASVAGCGICGARALRDSENDVVNKPIWRAKLMFYINLRSQ